MASRTLEENIGDYDLQYDSSLEISELLQEKIHSEELQSLFPEELNYKELLQDVMDLERSEGIVPSEESASDDISIFLEKFPWQREEIEKCIRCLKEIADKIDDTHKKCTIANIAATSTSLVSGILSILGLALVPLTLGGSLALTATGIGLGAAAAATGISANLYEDFSNSKESHKANDLLVTCKSNLQALTSSDEVDSRPTLSSKSEAQGDQLKHALSTTRKIPGAVIDSVRRMEVNVKALRVVKANSGLQTLAKRLTAAGSRGQVLKGAKQVQKPLVGTAFAMSKSARVLGATAAAAFVLLDAYSLVKDSIHLAAGAKMKAAADLRENIGQLEKDLQNLSELYEVLKAMVYK
ncbi:apolipoprotein L6-like [Carettochelys insculpta]|uniref:apolipoprotein L6-like n=1 Tax=Carettochelys insculpta TaxID=44489 RepID=UPI003EB704B4